MWNHCMTKFSPPRAVVNSPVMSLVHQQRAVERSCLHQRNAFSFVTSVTHSRTPLRVILLSLPPSHPAPPHSPTCHGVRIAAEISVVDVSIVQAALQLLNSRGRCSQPKQTLRERERIYTVNTHAHVGARTHTHTQHRHANTRHIPTVLVMYVGMPGLVIHRVDKYQELNCMASDGLFHLIYRTYL